MIAANRYSDHKTCLQPYLTSNGQIKVTGSLHTTDTCLDGRNVIHTLVVTGMLITKVSMRLLSLKYSSVTYLKVDMLVGLR